MDISAPSNRELNFRKALEVFLNCSLQNCQISSEIKIPAPCGNSVTSGKPSQNGEFSRTRENHDLDNRQTKRMKLHNPPNQLYDCSPSHTPDSAASYMTALDTEDVTSHDPVSSRDIAISRDIVSSHDPVSSRDIVSSHDPVSSRDNDRSPEAIVLDFQPHTATRDIKAPRRSKRKSEKLNALSSSNNDVPSKPKKVQSDLFEYRIRRRPGIDKIKEDMKYLLLVHPSDITSHQMSMTWNSHLGDCVFPDKDRASDREFTERYRKQGY